MKIFNVISLLPIASAMNAATTTRYWDCSGGSCGCAYLPSHLGGDHSKPSHCHSNAMFAAPADNPFGATFYGAAAISQALGGGDWLSSGCGKCWKVTGTSNIANYDAGTSTTLVLKGTNYCPPSNPSCSNNKAHFDIAAPGFDYVGSSISNTCAEVEPVEKTAFESCGSWMISSQDPDQNCNCDLFSSSALRDGCNNFKSLSWNNPAVTYEEITCPLELSQLPCWEENGNNYHPFGQEPELCRNPSSGDASNPTSVTNPTNPTNPILPTIAPTMAVAIQPSGDTQSGKATYYGGNENGNACGYNDLPKVSFPFGLASAAGGDAFNSGYGCGACYEITCVGPYGNNPSCFCDGSTPSVVVQVSDQCPECETTHFDLNPSSMEQVVADGLAGTCGVIETTVRRVNCNFQSNIKIRSKSGTSAYWYGLHIDDVAGYGAISNVELRTANSASFDVTCNKSQGASFWVCSFTAPLTFPMDVKLTDSAGRQLTGNGVITSGDGGTEFDFGSNFGEMDDSTTFNGEAPASAPQESSTISDEEAFSPLECFSSNVSTSVKGKGKVMMSNLQVGDQVLSRLGTYETLYAMDHHHATKVARFIQIWSHLYKNEPSLEVTQKHMTFLYGNPNPVPASSIKIGDELETIHGPSIVTKIETVIRDGIYSPLTIDGTIVVNEGIVASSYSALSINSLIEVANVPIVSYQTFFDTVLKPYQFMCIQVSLDLCKTKNERVLYSELGSRIYSYGIRQNTWFQLIILHTMHSFFGFISLILRLYGAVIYFLITYVHIMSIKKNKLREEL